MKKLLLFALIVPFFGLSQASKIEFTEDFEIPKAFISLPDFENLNIRDMAISPNYDEIFFTLDGPKYTFRTILTSKKVNGQWSPFEIASFSGNYHDIEPAFSPDGKQLFFASKRPIEGNEPKNDYDLFVMNKANGKWSTPKRLNENINTSDNEYYPSVASDGTLYFTATRMDTQGKEDIYQSEWKLDEYQKAHSVKGKLNTANYEYNAFVAPDKSYIIYGAYGRKGSLGRGDLYISFFENDEWQEGINLGEKINSSQIDYCPFVSSDGKYFFFTSEKTEVKTHYSELNLKTLKEILNQPANGISRVYYVPFEIVLKEIKSE